MLQRKQESTVNIQKRDVWSKGLTWLQILNYKDKMDRFVSQGDMWI